MEPEYILYRYWDSTDRLLYVGISVNALVRMTQHRDEAAWWSEADKVTFERLPTREAMYEAERYAIEVEHPLHNVVGVLTKHTTPKERRPSVSRERRARQEVVNRTLSYLPKDVVRGYRDRMAAYFMLVHNVSDVPLQRRLVLILAEKLFLRMYREAQVAEKAATGAPIYLVYPQMSDWSDCP